VVVGLSFLTEIDTVVFTNIDRVIQSTCLYIEVKNTIIGREVGYTIQLDMYGSD
jgi:hypothetical protein